MCFTIVALMLMLAGVNTAGVWWRRKLCLRLALQTFGSHGSCPTLKLNRAMSLRRCQMTLLLLH
jgi:hypothetical protein